MKYCLLAKIENWMAFDNVYQNGYIKPVEYQLADTYMYSQPFELNTLFLLNLKLANPADIIVRTSQLMQFCTSVNLRDTKITWGHLITKV